MWKVLSLLLIITYEATPYPQDEIQLLDKSDWRETEKDLLETLVSADMSDCSYVEDTIRTYENITWSDPGYMEIVISPELNGYWLKSGQNIRIILAAPHQPGNIVRLYKGMDTSGKPLFEIDILPSVFQQNRFHVDTDVVYKTGENYIAQYLTKNGEILITSRFNNVKPSWMWCMKEYMGNRDLGKIFFPGTHDSGSYTTPFWWKYTAATSLFFDLVYTQESSILSQLMQGARSFDLRVGKYQILGSDYFTINHDVVPIRYFTDVLDQIKEFLASSPNEIILLDFHRFPHGFKTIEDHEKLINLIKIELGDLIYWHPTSTTWSVTLNDIWKTKARIIIAYNQDTVPEMYNLYPGINQIWANAANLSELFMFMLTNLQADCRNADNTMTNAMAEITPHGMVGVRTGLRKYASETNSMVSWGYLIGPWGRTAQSVAVDFLSSTGIVTAAIAHNALRAQPDNVCH